MENKTAEFIEDYVKINIIAGIYRFQPAILRAEITEKAWGQEAQTVVSELDGDLPNCYDEFKVCMEEGFDHIHLAIDFPAPEVPENEHEEDTEPESHERLFVDGIEVPDVEIGEPEIREDFVAIFSYNLGVIETFGVAYNKNTGEESELIRDSEFLLQVEYEFRKRIGRLRDSNR